MTNELTLAPDFKLPPDAVTQTFAILAKRGVGKTYTGAVMAEEILKAGHQVVIVDPVGVWWGLRSSADGNAPGLPIAVLGGEHGDLPLDANSGDLIASLIVDSGLSLVLDLSNFRKGEQQRFMTAFAETLYHRNRQALHLILDEADAFAPQRPLKGGERLLGAIEDIVRRGRARGLGVTLITQRAAVLNKNVLTQIEVLVVLRTVAPQDLEAVDDWIKSHDAFGQRAQFMVSLPSLPIGTAWFWSPGWLDIFYQVQIRQRETFDSSATPKVGAATARPAAIAEINLDWLRGQLAQVVDQKAASDPKLLTRRIAELEKLLREKPTAVVERVEVPILGDDQIAHLTDVATQMIEEAERLIAFGQELMALIGQVSPKPQRAPTVPVAPSAPSAPVMRQAETNTSEINLKAGERKMLEILAQFHPSALTRDQLGTLAGFTVSGGTFGRYLSRIKRAELVEEINNKLFITDAGLAYLGSAPLQPLTSEGLLSMWRSALKSGEWRMLEALIDAYPNGLSRARLGETTSFTVSGGTFGRYLSRLNRNGLVVIEGSEVSASDALFLLDGVKN